MCAMETKHRRGRHPALRGGRGRGFGNYRPAQPEQEGNVEVLQRTVQEGFPKRRRQPPS